MRKIILTISLLAAVCCLTAGNPIPVQDAKSVGVNFLGTVSHGRSIGTADLSLVQTSTDIDDTPLYYVFAINGGGFIIVSATEAVVPILAYSLENGFLENAPNYLLEKYKALNVP